METTFSIPIQVTLDKVSSCLTSALEGGSNYWYIDFHRKKKRAPDLNFLKENLKDFDERFPQCYWYFGGEVEMTIGEEVFENKRLGVVVSPLKTIVVNKVNCEVYALNIERIKEGLELMAKKNPYQFGLLLNDEGDAVTGDVLLQYCLFGIEVFG